MHRRRTVRVSVVLGVGLGWWLGSGPRAAAGLYTTTDPASGPATSAGTVSALPFPAFHDELTRLLSLAVEVPESPARARLLIQARQLATAWVRAGRGSMVDDEINLSAAYVRLGKIPEAIDVLTRATARERGNFMLFANLGTAYQLEGRLDRAMDALERAQAVWPRRWPGLTAEQLAWLKNAEKRQSQRRAGWRPRSRRSCRPTRSPSCSSS